MPGVAERPRLAVLLLAPLFGPLFAGCGIELVRPSVEPAAVEVRPVAARLEAGIACKVELDPSVLAAMQRTRTEMARPYGGSDGVEDLVRHGISRDAIDPDAVTAKATLELVSAVQRGGAFRGEARSTGSPEGDALACEARLLYVAQVSEPVIRTGARHLMYALALVPPYIIGIPLCCMWTDREPDLVDRYALEVSVRGEEATAARYEVVARGTISAQNPYEYQGVEGLAVARATLRDLAIQSLVSRFAADEAAHARLRAQLDDSPPADLEPLLVTEERHVTRARWRTRKIVAWKNESLQVRVAEGKTSELRALAGRLEACMLDLSHQAEVSKDSAQGLVAGGSTGDAGGAREWSLAYRERVEALRPILAAVKEELDARGR